MLRAGQAASRRPYRKTLPVQAAALERPDIYFYGEGEQIPVLARPGALLWANTACAS